MKHYSKVKGLLLLLTFFVFSISLFGQNYTGLTATASSGVTPNSALFDGNYNAGWQDNSKAPALWVDIDLGSEKAINSAKIYWQNANAKDYDLQISTDKITWTTVASKRGMATGDRADFITDLNTTGRYVRMQGITLNTTYGYNIYEFEVYPVFTSVLTSIIVAPATTAPATSITLAQTKQFIVTGLDQAKNAMTLSNATVWSVNGTGASVNSSGLFSSTTKGFYTVTATNTAITKTATIDVFPSTTNLSIGSAATASSGTGAAAIDNNTGTRWESAFTDPQWIKIDLGTTKSIADMVIIWQNANSKDYIIEGSLNDTDWTTLVTKTNMATGERTDRIYDVNFSARYIRLTGSTRTTVYGHSIWEFKIFESASSAPNLTFAIPTSVTKSYGDAAFANLATSSNSAGAITYSSGNTNVATVNASTGEVSILSAGTSVITATIAAAGSYSSTTATYTLSVSGIANITFTTPTSVIKNMGDAAFTNLASSNNSAGVITYTSGNTNVATVNANTGEITILSAGTSVITANIAAAGDFLMAGATYTLTVNALPNIAFASPTSVIKNMGDAVFTNLASSSNSAGAITYSSGNTNMATVNASTGEITILSVGTSVITAIIAAYGDYQSSSVSYILTVNPNGTKYAGLTAITSDAASTTVLFDGNTGGGRWQDSGNTDAGWVTVNLGSVKNVNYIRIYWEAANALAYNVLTSTDNINWTTVATKTAMAAGNRTDLISGLNVDCQYIKMQGVTRQLPYGYSIYEFEVYPVTTPILTLLEITPVTSSITQNATKQFSATGFDQLGEPFSLTNTTTWSVNGTGASIDANGLFSSTNKGIYTVTATNSGKTSTATIDVLPSSPNLSIASGVSATATASSGTASAAFDNNLGSRWESVTSDPQWIKVDLGAVKSIIDMVLTWETASSKDYVIEGSVNGNDWTTIVSKTNMPAGPRTDLIFDLSASARYVRLTGTSRNTIYGHSIYEFQIYGPAPIAPNFVFATPISVSKNVGDAAFTNAATSSNSAGTISYSSDNTNAATVNATSGEVTLVAHGTALISATIAANGSYASASVSYALQIARQTVTVVGTESSSTLNNTSAQVNIPNNTVLNFDVEKTVHAIFVEPGGSLNITSPMTVDTLTFKAGKTNSFSTILNHGITVNNTVRFLKTLDPSKWFFMSFPCDVKISDIKQTAGQTMNLSTDLFIKYYNGANRSNGNLGSNWIKMLSNETLTANQGYIFGISDGLGDVELEFPLSTSLVSTAEALRGVPVNGNQGTSIRTTDQGWNLVGQPYLSRFVGANASNVNFMLFSDGLTNYTTYSRFSTDYPLPLVDPFAAYFIQVGSTGTIPFAVAGRSLAPAAVATNLSEIVQLNVITSTGTDNTAIIMDNDQSTAYQIGQDMEKWLGTSAVKPQLYTTLSGINYAYNALPVSSVQNLPLGIYSKTLGRTTISANGAGAPSVSNLILNDKLTGTTTDLLKSDYSFTATTVTTNTRFSITAQRITTAILNENKTDSPKLSSNKTMLLVKNLDRKSNVRVYDLLGRLVFNHTSNSDFIEIPLPNGVYNVQVNSSSENWSSKYSKQ